MQREISLADVEAWAQAERRERRSKARTALLQNLVDQVERDRRLPQPDALEPGSPERLAAQGRQRRIRNLAQALGYRPAGEELAAGVAEHALIEASGLPGLAKAGLEAAAEGGVGPDPADRSESGDRSPRHSSDRDGPAAPDRAETADAETVPDDRPSRRRRRRHRLDRGNDGPGLELAPWT